MGNRKIFYCAINHLFDYSKNEGLNKNTEGPLSIFIRKGRDVKNLLNR
jgi:hypothetical protein